MSLSPISAPAIGFGCTVRRTTLTLIVFGQTLAVPVTGANVVLIASRFNPLDFGARLEFFSPQRRQTRRAGCAPGRVGTDPMHDQHRCSVCGTAMIQKSRSRLLVVGVGLVATLALAPAFPMLWVPAVVAGVTGLYLIVWATAGNARWCRQCKTFRISS